MRTRALARIAALAWTVVAASAVVAQGLDRKPAAPLLPGKVSGPPPLDFADRGKTISAERGARVRVLLDADRTSAQRWWLEGIDGGAVIAYGSPVFASPDFRDLRAPGSWVFEFEAVAPGRSTLRFGFRDARAPAAEAARKAEYVVDVVERSAP